MLCCLCPAGCPVSTEEVLTQIHFSETDSSISTMLSPRASFPETLSLYPQSTAQEQETEPVHLKAIMIPFITTYYNSEPGHRHFQSDLILSGTLGARRGGSIASGPVGLGVDGVMALAGVLTEVPNTPQKVMRDAGHPT